MGRWYKKFEESGEAAVHGSKRGPRAGGRLHKLSDAQKMGFSYQCPVLFAREQQPAQVRKWLDETYPVIRKEAAECGATILWADKSTVLSAETKAHGHSPIGVAPVLRSPANRSIRCNMISAVGNKGDMQFMIFEGAMNVDVFKDIVERLTKDSESQIFLIVDNLRVHHAKCLAPWLKEREKEVRKTRRRRRPGRRAS